MLVVWRSRVSFRSGGDLTAGLRLSGVSFNQITAFWKSEKPWSVFIFFLVYFISKDVFLILPKSIHFFFGEDLSFLLIFKPFESLKIHGSVVSLVSSRSGAPRNARRSPRDLCDWSGRGNPNTSKSVTLKMFQGLRILSGCNRRLKMSGCKTIRIFEFTGWQVPHKKAAQSSSWEPMRWKDIIWKQLIVYIIYTPDFQLATNFLQDIHRYTIYKYIASLVIPLSDFFRPSTKDFGENCFGRGCDGINGLLSGVPWMMVEITGNSGVSNRPKQKQNGEAAALRCLSDVVDAGDRNFEIDIAEEFPVLDQTFGIVFDLFSINLGSIILHDAWISLCKDI